MLRLRNYCYPATKTHAWTLSPHEALLLPSRTAPRLPNWQFRAPGGPHVYSFRPAAESERALKRIVGKLSRDIRKRHRTKVKWPNEAIDDTINQSSVERVVSPVLFLFSQLRAPVIKHPLQSVTTKFDDDILSVTISSIYSDILDSPPIAAKTPVLIFLPTNALGNCEQAASKLPQLSQLFRKAWNTNSGSKIVCTDLNSLFILQLSSTEPDTVIQEQLLIDQGLVRARIAIAAYIYDALPENAYLTFPRSTKAYDPPVIDGCLPDPNIPMLSDEEVFTTRKCHRDFDLYTLMNTPPAALQFLRWKAYMKDQAKQIQTIRSGDSLHAISAGFEKENVLLTPYWPVDVDSISSETMDCIRMLTRPHGVDAITRVRLAASTTFEIKILDQLAAMREPRGATVHRCQIVSIDGDRVNSGPSNLCVKIFDDRLLVMYPPDEPDEETVGPDEGWWCGWSTNEDCVRKENAAYQQLSFAQGSLVPWYYGAHKFTRPDGHSLYGILLEFVPDAKTVDDIPLMSEEHRIQLIRNARHALRAMQYADISQHDFHREQLIVLHNPVPHVVLFDFASASISTEPEAHEGHDYANMLSLLSERRDDGERDLTVLSHFGEREVWDRTMNTWPDGKGSSIMLVAPDPFAWCLRIENKQYSSR